MQAGQPRLADLERGGLGLDVADPLLGDAHVGHEDGEDLAVHLAPLEELDGRQAQALLLHLGGVRREAARHHAADVGPVARVLQPAEVLATVVEGQRKAHVHQVRAAEIGIVDDIDVAGLGRPRLAFADQADQLARGILHGADEDRQAELALADQRAGVLVVDARGAVVGLGDHGREGRAREGDVHLVADLAEARLDHGECERVDRAHGSPCASDLDPQVADVVDDGGGGRVDHGGRVDLLDDGGPFDACLHRQLHPVEDMRHAPAAVGEHLALADQRALDAGRAAIGIEQGGEREAAAAADHRGGEIDQHRPDLRQAYLEAGEIGRLEQRLDLGARRRRRWGRRRGSDASGRGTACRRRAALWSRRSRSAPRRSRRCRARAGRRGAGAPRPCRRRRAAR